MKNIDEIKFGFSDAENYRRRENKQFFSQIFLRTDAINRLDDPSVFFLVGEKGTGKTAYAVSRTSNRDAMSRSMHIFLRETDYSKFVSLKRENGLTISDYVDVWKLILLMSVSKGILETSSIIDRIVQGSNYSSLKSAIERYYVSGLDPEIVTALQIVENIEESADYMQEAATQFAATDGASQAKVSAKVQASSGEKVGREVRKERHRFQRSISEIQRIVEPAIHSIKLKGNFTLFVDGIDIRPSAIAFTEYLDCVKGLANAAWALNNDLFPQTRDSRGRIKIILLLRPDIFNSLGLQNRNTKLKDNSVILRWVTDYDEHRTSPLFQLSDKLFSAQQDQPGAVGAAWDFYLPFDAPNYDRKQSGQTSFVSFLRQSYHRPRDIMTMLDILNDIRNTTNPGKAQFTFDDLTSATFRTRYAEYLLGEIKDALSFYYDEAEFELFLNFFSYLNGANRFDYQTFLNAFQDFDDFIRTQSSVRPGFMKTADEFLQFLYDQNILNYVEIAEDEKFIRWCFRERSMTNISPKVKFGMTYEIHYGLANALNTGKKFKAPQKAAKSTGPKLFSGRVKKLFADKNFGFLVSDDLPLEIYFRFTADLKRANLMVGSRVSFGLEKVSDGKMQARDVTIKTS